MQIAQPRTVPLRMGRATSDPEAKPYIVCELPVIIRHPFCQQRVNGA